MGTITSLIKKNIATCIVIVHVHGDEANVFIGSASFSTNVLQTYYVIFERIIILHCYQSLGVTHSAWAVISTTSLFDSLSTR